MCRSDAKQLDFPDLATQRDGTELIESVRRGIALVLQALQELPEIRRSLPSSLHLPSIRAAVLSTSLR